MKTVIFWAGLLLFFAALLLRYNMESLANDVISQTAHSTISQVNVAKQNWYLFLSDQLSKLGLIGIGVGLAGYVLDRRE